jgi:hypothetical protein
MSQLYERPPTQQIVLVSLYINLIQWSSWRWRPFASASTSLKVTKTHQKRIKNASKTPRSRDNAAPILINFGLALLALPLHNLLQKRMSYCHRDQKKRIGRLFLAHKTDRFVEDFTSSHVCSSGEKFSEKRKSSDTISILLSTCSLFRVSC